MSLLKNTKEQFMSDTSKLKPENVISKKISKSFSNSNLIPFKKTKNQEIKCELYSKSETILTTEKTNNIYKSQSDYNLESSSIQRVTSENDLSSLGYLNFAFKSDLSSSLPDTHRLDSFEENCKNCKCCIFLENQVASLKLQLDWYESFFNITPEVRRWLDEIKPKAYMSMNENNSLDDSKNGRKKKLFSKSFRSNSNSEQTSKFSVVPKIKIDSWIQ